ncbi:MAG TPA: transcription factor S [Nitrososphaerales archaeon]|nr:transcription factor S [Nitrososphaerales archaeon]
MKFCPKCGTRLKYKPQKEGAKLICDKCGYSQEAGPNIATPEVVEIDASGSTIKVLGEKEEKIKTMPTTNVDCPKCGHNVAFWWFLQTRSGDEPPTQFFRCEKCGHTWRQYS